MYKPNKGLPIPDWTHGGYTEPVIKDRGSERIHGGINWVRYL